MDWKDLRDSAPSLEIIKAELPPSYVLQQYGHEVVTIAGRLVTNCPFHTDRNPSFDIFEREGVQRLGCYPCGFQGDVIDLLQKLDSCTFSEAWSKATELLRAFKEAGSIAPTPVARPSIPAESVADALARSTGSLTALEEAIDAKRWPVTAEWVAETFGVVCVEDDVLIPFQDWDGQWSGYKIRNGKEKLAAPGSRFDAFYGHWLDQNRKDVILTEGEPDTWSATFAVGARYDVLGLATGAGARPKEPHLDRLRDRKVVLAFDGDDAGRTATRRWVTELQGVAASVRIVRMPEGMDLSELDDISRAIEYSSSPLPDTSAIKIYNGVFSRVKGDNMDPICNWSFVPTRELEVAEGSRAYEGRLSNGQDAVLTAEDTSSASRISAWSQAHGLGWRGQDRDARDLLILLEAEGPYLATGKMTRVLGLHEKHFVLPEVTIGPEKWAFLPKPGIITKHLDFAPHVNWQDTLLSLFDLHTTEVMHPLLAWLAAAPIRSLVDEFPILAVTGSSGAGKTTLLKTVLQTFSGGALGGKDGISLADTTKHAITEHAGATNAFPVWFDEYRASIRYDTRDALHNTLLASYIGQTTSKGSVTERGLGVTNWAHFAPVIVSGENTFAETAHVERMVLIALPQTGRNPEALREIQASPTSGIAEAFLHWLIYRYDLPDAFTIAPYGSPALSSRTRTNFGVLQLGWRLLGEFMWDTNLGDLPALDLSLVTGEAQESADDDPILECIRWAVEEAGVYNGTPLVVVQNRDVYVRVESLVSEVMRNRRFALPGGGKAIRRVLIEKYGGIEVKETFSFRFDQPTRFVKVSLDRLGF